VDVTTIDLVAATKSIVCHTVQNFLSVTVIIFREETLNRFRCRLFAKNIREQHKVGGKNKTKKNLVDAELALQISLRQRCLPPPYSTPALPDFATLPNLNAVKFLARRDKASD